MSTATYLTREAERTNEDLMREVLSMIGNLKGIGDAVRNGAATMRTDTDWLASSAAKVERLVEKRNLLATLVEVEERAEEKRTGVLPLVAVDKTLAVQRLLDLGWTQDAALNHVEGTCDIAVCTGSHNR